MQYKYWFIPDLFYVRITTVYASGLLRITLEETSCKEWEGNTPMGFWSVESGDADRRQSRIVWTWDMCVSFSILSITETVRRYCWHWNLRRVCSPLNTLTYFEDDYLHLDQWLIKRNHQVIRDVVSHAERSHWAFDCVSSTRQRDHIGRRINCHARMLGVVIFLPKVSITSILPTTIVSPGWRQRR